MSKFQRESRYTIFKKSDVFEALCPIEQTMILELQDKIKAHRKRKGKNPLECVVVEADWPEYEPTWATIESRVLGTTPSPEYFVYDSDGGFETFNNIQDRDKYAEDSIQGYLDDGWSEEVTTVCAGVITHKTIQTDLVKRPDIIDEEGHDESGTWWDADWGHMCNYALVAKTHDK
ncbi:MAG: hypothetical protein JKY50_07345 [Oleispira sp.]|nr:hypothetical protein [Oleispira sp.]MBL4881184.1 hypothetical protein [Oleispira sp.]